MTFKEGWCPRLVSCWDGVLPGWSVIRVSLSEWCFIRAVSHYGGLSSGWSLIRVVFVRVVSYQGGLSQGGLSPWQSLIRMVCHWGGLSSGWSHILVVSHLGGVRSGVQPPAHALCCCCVEVLVHSGYVGI